MSFCSSFSQAALCSDNSAIKCIYLLSILGTRLVVSQGCLTTQTDHGATKLREIRQTLKRAECELVESVSYQDYSPTWGEEFDFIVVGGGTAGSVVASRLSENPDCRVLLLEAGGDPDITTEFPSLRGELIGSPLDWNDTAEPDGWSCLGSVGQRCVWPAGKVLGGSSTINGMIYNRGNPEVFNSWEREGNFGWGYESLLPYFKKSEDLESYAVKENPNYKRYHGDCGFLTVESIYHPYLEGLVNNVSDSLTQIGLGTYNDINTQFNDGLFHLQGTIRDGRRCSTAKAFLKPAEPRRNFKLSKNSFVTKVLIDENKQAYGAEFQKCGSTITVRARKEVIVSAGTIRSPQLLMLSGIGPREHLRQLGIQVVSDLQVGFNLKDHYAVNGVFASLNINISLEDDKSFYGVLFQSKGTYDTDGNTVEAYFTTSCAEYRNILFVPTYTPVNANETILRKYGFNEDYIESVNRINAKRSLFYFYPILVNPKSSGRIMLRSRNPNEYPLIFPKYITVEEDVEDLLEGIQFALQVFNTKAMKELGARVERLDIPDCRAFPFPSIQYWKCIIRYTGSSDYHYVGTCRMGPRGKPGSVVDPNLQVIGVGGLRVVDGSVIPIIPNSNTMTPIIAVAEKASDLIKSYWRRRE